jgi:hypothetical protein
MTCWRSAAAGAGSLNTPPEDRRERHLPDPVASQRDYALARIEREGLSDKVEIKLQDYRDETGVYDRVASIEMFEAVGQEFWPSFS